MRCLFSLKSSFFLFQLRFNVGATASLCFSLQPNILGRPQRFLLGLGLLLLQTRYRFRATLNFSLNTQALLFFSFIKFENLRLNMLLLLRPSLGFFF